MFSRNVVPMVKGSWSIHAFQVGTLVATCYMLGPWDRGLDSRRFPICFPLRLLGAVLAAFLFSKVRPTDFGVPMSAANLQEQLRLGWLPRKRRRTSRLHN